MQSSPSAPFRSLINKYADSYSTEQIVNLINKTLKSQDIYAILNEARESSTLSNIADDFARIMIQTRPILNHTASSQHMLNSELQQSITPFTVTWFAFTQLIPQSDTVYASSINFHGYQLLQSSVTDNNIITSYEIRFNNTTTTGTFESDELVYIIGNVERLYVETSNTTLAKPRNLKADFISQDEINIMRTEIYRFTILVVKYKIETPLTYSAPTFTVDTLFSSIITTNQLTLETNFYSTTGHDTCQFYYAQPEYELLESFELIELGIEYLLITTLTEAIQYQAAMYKVQQHEYLAEAEEQATDDLTKNITQLNQDVAELAEIVASALVFKLHQVNLSNVPSAICVTQAELGSLPEHIAEHNIKNLVANSTLVHYSNNDKLTIHPITSTNLGFQESEVLYEDNEIIVLAEFVVLCDSEYSDYEQNWTNTNKPIRFSTLSDIFYDTTYLQTIQPAKIQTGFQYQNDAKNGIDLPPIDMLFTWNIQQITILYKAAYSNLIDIQGEIAIKITNPLNGQEFYASSTNPISISHNTDKYGELFGITFPINQAFTNKLRNMQHLSNLKSFLATQDILLNPTQYELNAKTPIQYYTDNDISLQGAFYASTDVLRWHQTDYYVMQWHEWSTQQELRIKSYSLTRKIAPAFNYTLPTFSDWTFFGKDIKQHQDIVAQRSSTYPSPFGAAVHSAGIKIDRLTVKALVPTAPGNLGFRIRFDESVNLTQILAKASYVKIVNIEQTLVNIADRISSIEENIRILWDVSFPDTKSSLLNIFVDTLLETVLPIGIGVAAALFKKMVSTSVLLARSMTQMSSSNSLYLKQMLTSNHSLPLHEISTFRSKLNVNAAKEKQGIDFGTLETNVRPIFSRQDNSKNAKFEEIDLADAIDFNYVTHNKINKLDQNYSPLNSTLKNVQTTDLPTPSYSFNIEPLSFLGKMGGPVYSLTNSSLSKKLTQANIARHSTLMPVHATGSTTRDFRKNGQLYRRLTCVGIAEAPMARIPVAQTKSQLGGSIGGMILDYKQIGIDANGKNIFRYLTWQEHGHSAEMVETWFTRMYGKRDIQGIDKNDKATWMWHQIVGKIENKAKPSRSLYTTYIPDTSRLAALEDLIAKTSKFDYNLLTNNCQTFAKQLGTYLHTGDMLTCIPQTTILEMYQAEMAHVLTSVRSISEIIGKRMMRLMIERLPLRLI